MALTLTGLAPAYASGCNHYVITINDNGTIRTLRGLTPDDVDSFDDLRNVPTQASPALVALWALVILWIRYERAHGASFASLIGQVIAP